jgi:hypothetical protein
MVNIKADDNGLHLVSKSEAKTHADVYDLKSLYRRAAKVSIRGLVLSSSGIDGRYLC